MFANNYERKVFVLKDGQVYVVRLLKVGRNNKLSGYLVFKLNGCYSCYTFENRVKGRFA
jgi:hypothetical protein